MPDSPSAKPERHVISELRNLWWLVALGLFGLIFFCVVQGKVFPSASIDLKVPKSQILSLSEKWAQDLGYETKGSIKSTEFSYDNEAKTFLESELSLSQANTLMKERIPVWFWSTRFCKEFQQEYMYVYLRPDGSLHHFYHWLENDRTIPTIPKDEALKLARDFVEGKGGIKVSDWKLVVNQSITQLHRTDYSFVWEDQSAEWNGARMRTSAYVAGNKVTRFYHYLYEPETWERKFNTMRSYNRLLQNIASFFSLLISIAYAFVFLWAFVTKQIRWRFALLCGGLMAALVLFDAINELEISVANYGPEGSFQAFLISLAMRTFFSAVGSFFSTAVLFSTAEVTYRLFFRRHVAMENLFTSRALRSPQILAALIVGHCAFGISLLWQMSYYLVGKKLGVWCPLEITNYQVLSAHVPAFSSMMIGILAATNEEFTYRIIGLSLVQKLVGKFWIANFAQAIVWGFMHSSYPQQPPYARGVELTIAGLFYGWVLKRYGILACLIAHYLFDAMWGVVPLLTSPLPALKLSAVIAVIPFALVIVFALWLIRKQGMFIEPRSISNAATRNKKTPATDQNLLAEIIAFHYQPFSTKLRIVLGVLVAALIVVCFVYHEAKVGTNAHPLVISRQQAIRIAQQHLQTHHYNLSGRKISAYLTYGMSSSLQYIFEKVGFKKTDQLAMTTGTPYLWSVRFFRPMDPEEFRIMIDDRGRIAGCELYEAEDAPGARLTEEKAKEMAARFIVTLCPEFAPITFESTAEHKRKNRTDYTFTFSAPNFRVAEANHKAVATVVGDTVSGFSNYWDIPSAWLWKKEKRTTQDEISQNIKSVAYGLLGLLALWFVWGVFRTGAVHWRQAILGGTLIALSTIPEILNNWPQMNWYYQTTTPWTTFMIEKTLGYLGRIASDFSSSTFLIAMSLACLRIICPKLSVSSVFRMAMRQGEHECKIAQMSLWIDGIIAGYASFLVVAIISTIFSPMEAHFSQDVQQESFSRIYEIANVSSPTLEILLDAIQNGIKMILAAPIIAGVYAKFCPKGFPMYIAVIITAAAITLSSKTHWQEITLGILEITLIASWLWIWMVKLARQNVLAYFFCGYGGPILWMLIDIYRYGLPLFAQDFALIAMLFLWPLFYVLYLKVSDILETLEKNKKAKASETS